ncbi:MAG: hypothetical protein FJ090_09885 [Deltaproteobacteria bacterium]|nr:hypothetical protein [Deltaproteobacteria bacterium]
MVLLLLSCSLGVTGWEPCTTGSECRDAFGFGYTCGDEGYCEEVALADRCDATYPDDLFVRPEDYPGILVVGTLFDHSTDVPEKQASRLAIKQVDDSQGLDGTLLGLVQCSYEEDSALDGLAADEAAAAMGEYLAGDLGAFAIVGPATSGNTEAMWNATADLGALVVSPSATSPALTYLDAPTTPEGHAGRLWRTAPPDDVQGLVLAEVVATTLTESGRTNQDVAVVYQEGPYGTGLAEVFVENYQSSFHVPTRYAFENDTERDNAINNVAKLDYDAILFISSDLPDVSAFLNAAGARDEFNEMPIFLADASRDAELLEDTREAASQLWTNILGTAPAVPSGDVYDAFAASYAAEYEGQSARDSSYSAYAYDAGWLVAYGAAWAYAQEAGVTGQGAADGLLHISNPDGELIEIAPNYWSQLRAAFSGARDVNVQGASGALDYDPVTQETTGPIDIWKIASDGQSFEVVETKEP